MSRCFLSVTSYYLVLSFNHITQETGFGDFWLPENSNCDWGRLIKLSTYRRNGRRMFSCLIRSCSQGALFCSAGCEDLPSDVGKSLVLCKPLCLFFVLFCFLSNFFKLTVGAILNEVQRKILCGVHVSIWCQSPCEFFVLCNWAQARSQNQKMQTQASYRSWFVSSSQIWGLQTWSENYLLIWHRNWAVGCECCVLGGLWLCLVLLQSCQLLSVMTSRSPCER